MLRRLYLILAAILVACAMVLSPWLPTVAATSQTGEPAWVNPGAMTLKQIGQGGGLSDHAVLTSNLSCASVVYNVAGSNLPHTGCLTFTAFGFMDIDNGAILFAGTDKALPLTTYIPGQILVPWPKTIDMIGLASAPTGGSYLSLYTNILGDLANEYNSVGQVIGKRLVRPPDIIVRDNTGQPLIIYPSTLAFSDNSSWLVAETVNGVFVRINLASLLSVPFAPAFSTLGNAQVGNVAAAVSNDGRFVAIANATANTLSVYDLSGCANHPVTGLQLLACPSHNYWDFVNSRIPNLTQLYGLQFVNGSLLGFTANGNRYELAPTAGIDHLVDYLALGDSFTAGEGAYDYASGTDTGDNVCHLSLNSYPVLLSRDLFTTAGGHSVACSGARSQDIVPSNPSGYLGQVRGGIAESKRDQTQVAQFIADFAPGYLAQSAFAAQYQPGALSLSVGGNDIGFGSILESCVAPHLNPKTPGNDCFNTYEDRKEVTDLVDRMIPRWTALYKQVASQTPASTIYVIGYPQLVVDNGDCAVNVHLSQAELAFSEELIDYLNQALAQAAAAAGVPFIDISQALAGHRLCEVASYDAAVNGLTAGKDAGIFGIGLFSKASYHPNALGQALMEQAILHQTHNLSQVSSGSSAGSTAGSILSGVPKSGRTIFSLIFDTLTTSGALGQGSTLPVSASGSTDGLVPHMAYVVHLDGSGGPVLGSLAANALGDVSGSVNLPTDVLPGGHTLDLTGPSQTDQPVDIRQPIVVNSSSGNGDNGGGAGQTPSNTSGGNLVQPDDPQPDGSSTVSGDTFSPQLGGQADLQAAAGDLTHEPSLTVIESVPGRNATANRAATLAHTVSHAAQVGHLNLRPAQHTLALVAPVLSLKPQLATLRVFHWLNWVGLYMLLWALVVIASYWTSRLTRPPHPRPD